MKSFPKTKPNLWDGCVVAVILALALGGWVWLGQGDSDALSLVISAQGGEIETITVANTSMEKELQAGGYVFELVIDGGEVWLERADCPTQDCVHTGRISKAGQSIVCLPARLSLRLMGANADIDVVIG